MTRPRTKTRLDLIRFASSSALPPTPALTAQVVVGTRTATEPVGNSAMNILLVDDDPGLRKTLRLALETMGNKISEASDTAQALDLLGQRFFDVCFLDLRLGKEQGLDTLQALLRITPGLAVVMMTAYATIETAVEAMRRGA